MPVSIQEIEQRFSTRNEGAPLPPELRDMATRLGGERDSAALVCEELEAFAKAKHRYQAVVEGAGELTDEEARLARDELGKNKPVSVVVAIIKAARRKKSASAAIPEGAGPPGQSGPRRRP